MIETTSDAPVGVEARRAALMVFFEDLAPRAFSKDLAAIWQTEEGLRHAIKSAQSVSGLLALEQGLSEVAALVNARARRRADEEARQELNRTPLAEGDLEFEAARRLTEREQAAAEFRASTNGRLEAIEGVLRDIRDALKRERPH